MHVFSIINRIWLSYFLDYDFALIAHFYERRIPFHYEKKVFLFFQILNERLKWTKDSDLLPYNWMLSNHYIESHPKENGVLKILCLSITHPFEFFMFSGEKLFTASYFPFYKDTKKPHLIPPPPPTLIAPKTIPIPHS